MKLYADGLSAKEVASEMGLSLKGMEYHRFSLFRKLQLKSMAQLVKMAVAFGMTSLCLVLHAGTVVLSWTNTNSTNLDVNIYYTTNVAIPTNQWPLLVYLTNTPPGPTSFVTNLPPANYFFIAAFTNRFWGTESFFSNGAWPPFLATNLQTGFSVSNH